MSIEDDSSSLLPKVQAEGTGFVVEWPD
jgi:hypothetical protein